LRLEVVYTNKEGDEHKGDFEFDFDAKGFGPGCNSQSVPRFTLIPVEKPAPVETSKPKNEPKKPADSREHDQGEDAPVAPPDQSGYAK